MPSLLQTTIAGSLPKPAWLASPGQLWAPWLLEGERLAEGKRDAVRLALYDQERAGIDIVTDGEQTRRHFVDADRKPDGVDFQRKKTVRIRSRYDAEVPVVVGPVMRRHPVFAEDARFLRGATKRKTKYTLPGPMTMVDTLYDAYYGSREKLAWAFADILNDEALRNRGGRCRRHPVRRARVQRLFRRSSRLGYRRARTGGTGSHVCDRCSHLLRLRDQGQHRVEKDAGRRVATVREHLPFARAFENRPGFARMLQLACTTRVDRPAAGQGRARRRHRRRNRPCGERRGRRSDDPRRAQVRSCRENLSLHQLRDGPALKGGRAGKTRGPRRRRRAGPPRVGQLIPAPLS